jgi:hypothetical protein
MLSIGAMINWLKRREEQARLVQSDASDLIERFVP